MPLAELSKALVPKDEAKREAHAASYSAFPNAICARLASTVVPMKITGARAIAAAAAAGLILTLGACSSNGDADGAESTTSAATETTQAEEATTEASEEATQEETTAAPAGDATAEFLSLVERGVNSLTTAKVRSETVSSAFTSSTEGVIDFTGASIAMQSVTKDVTGTAGGDSTTILIDGVMYVQSPELTGDKFMKLDTGSGLADLFASATVDPREQVKTLESALISVENKGKGEVEGVEATHFTVVSDPSKSAPAGLAGAELPATVTSEMWLDSEGRQVLVEVSVETGGITATVKNYMSDFGTPVTITAPTADQIVEVPGMS